MDDLVQRLRSFNRFYTRRLGLLTDQYLGQDRPLADARVLHQIGVDGVPIRDLRRTLDLDSGYLSRVLRSLERDGLVTTSASGGDRRLRVVRPTAKGRDELAEMDRRANAATADMFEQLDPAERRQLVAAVDTVGALLRLAASRDHKAVRLRQAVRADAPAIAALLLAAFSEQRDHFTDEAFALSTPDADVVAGRIGAHRVWVVEWEDRIVGTVTVELRAPSGYVRSLVVDPAVRGLRIASRLLDTAEEDAVAHGLARLELTTTPFQVAAAAVYRRHGFRRTGREDVAGTEMIRMRKRLS